MRTLPLDRIPSPCYVIDEQLLERNLDVFRTIKDRTGVRVLMALKAFSTVAVFSLIQSSLDGFTASSPYELRLGIEHFGGDRHIYSPGYSDEDIDEVLLQTDCIVFNSASQLNRFRDKAVASGVKIGLRINPEHSESKTELYDPCAPCSRLGIKIDELLTLDLEGVSGLHVHALCENQADATERLLGAVETRFASILRQMDWVNIGGGHLVTHPDYDLGLFCRLVSQFSDAYDVQVIMEPGTAVVYGTGSLIGSVLDIVSNTKHIAILNVSAAAHMPDVLEMPYRPDVTGAGAPGENGYDYLLTANTCLAGDVIGEYSFDTSLNIGDKVVLQDMAHYTTVKNTWFNGVQLPGVGVLRSNGDFEIVQQFDYADFSSRHVPVSTVVTG